MRENRSSQPFYRKSLWNNVHKILSIAIFNALHRMGPPGHNQIIASESRIHAQIEQRVDRIYQSDTLPCCQVYTILS